jgi:5-methylthioribose kinase
MTADAYRPLDAASLPARLGDLPALRAQAGDPATWQVREVGDGNLNLVFIVEGATGGVVVKQALPYVRLVGDSWPLGLQRSWFEYNALTRQQARDPGSVPAVHHFDRDQAMVVMDYLDGHVILRHSLMAGERHPGLGAFLGRFCARTLFRGSGLAMAEPDRKADIALFAGNTELCDITESLVFTDPWREAPLNRFTPALAPLVAQLRADPGLKIATQRLKTAFITRAETLLHGDLHTGSVMVRGDSARVIDPEFAVYGPMGFDVGMLIANVLMAFLAQAGHEAAPGARDTFRDWLLTVVRDIWTGFESHFTSLWHTERRGILYPDSLFEDQDQPDASGLACAGVITGIWRDALGFAGCEMHRRILGLAHIAEYDRIADETLRARCEAQGLILGRALLLGQDHVAGLDALFDLTRSAARRDAA